MATLWLENAQQRGVAWGPELPRLAQADVPPLGVNLFLDRESDEAVMRRSLTLARDLGAHWVKQMFPWDGIEPTRKGYFWRDDLPGRPSSWERYDLIVALCQEYGLELIVRLDRPPAWARQQALASEPLQAALAEDPTLDISGPPDNLEDYGDFVYNVVSRYRGRVHYIQLWNEPNLANEWNWAPIDPVRFVELLRVGYTRAKEADPSVVVLFPSLAPNDGLDPRHMSDLAFLDAVYRAGGGPYFDVMSAQLYGLGQPPDEHVPLGFDRQKLRPITRTDISRVVLLREVMEAHGDAGKAIWVGELGWNATPPDWAGRPSPWGTPVDEETKGRYIVQALERSLREWPWMGVRNIWFLCWNGLPPEPDDPTRFFALVDEAGNRLPAYTMLQAWASTPPLGVGYHDLGGRTQVEQPFLGTRLDIVLPAGADPATVLVTVDGQVRPLRFWRNEGDEARYVAAAGLSDARHSLVASAPAGLLRGVYIVREQPRPWLFPALSGLLSLLLLATTVLLVLRLPAGLRAAWQGAWCAVGRFERLPERWQALIVLGGLALCLAAIYRPLPLAVALAVLALMVVLAVLRLDLALLAAIFVLPLYPQPAELVGSRFSLFELTMLVCVAAGVLHLFRPNPLSPFPKGKEGLGNWRWWPMALPALVFLLVCTGSLLWSTDHAFVAADGTALWRISLREYRVTIVEPFLFYPLLLLTLRGRPGRAWWPADALVLSGALVALGGIVQVLTPSLHAEVADGVRRATSVYGTFSANALALFLGRVLALAAAGALFLSWGRRRWLYMAAGVVLLAAFWLTYSRAGYIALALVLLFYGLLHRRLVLWIELGLGAAGALAALAMGALDRLLALDTLRNRLAMWQKTWELIRERPLQGYGLDAYYHYYSRRFGPVEAYWNPNNGVLEFWTRLGLLGLTAAAWLYGAFFAHAGRLYRRCEEPAGRVLLLGLMGSVLYALAHGLLDGQFFAPDWAATFWVAYGLVAVLEQGGQSPGVAGERPAVGNDQEAATAR